MFSFYLLIGILLISFVFFFLGNNQAKILANSNQKNFIHLYIITVSILYWHHSYQPWEFFFTITICDDFLFAELIKKYIPNEVVNSKDYNFTIVLAQINNSVEGLIFGTPPEWVTNAAEIWKSWVIKSNIITAVVCAITILVSGFFSLKKIKFEFRSRNAVEKIVTSILAVSSIIAILTTIAIIFSVVFESIRFFALIPYNEFLFGTVWNPQFEGAERAGSGQEGLSQYGAIPLFAGTFLISIIALCVSVPVGLFSAIYLSEYATTKERAFLNHF